MITVAADDQAAAIAVRDHGVGLAVGESAMVFNRFWRADPARARTSGGTGLGLAISMEDTHLHGGWLQAWGKPNEGAQFRLTLPRRAGHPLRHSPLAARARGRRGGGGMSRRAAGSRHRRALAAVVVAAGACLTACVQVPDAGPVVQAEEPVQTAPIDNPYNNPPPPAPGASPVPHRHRLPRCDDRDPAADPGARKYLTSAGQSVWEPEQGVVAYSGLRPPHGTTTVRDRLRGADRIGPAGQWLGPVSRAASRLTFPMRKENGEWRIASAPNALLVPRTFYEQSFQDASLYFFDPTGRILVPEVVHMPQGQQLITALVHALLLGPRPSLTGVVRTFVPPGLDVDPLVVRNGTAGVILSGQDPGLLSATTTRLMLSQLAWTLRQDPSVSTFTLTIAGRTDHRQHGRVEVLRQRQRVQRLRPRPRRAPARRSTPSGGGVSSPGRSPS